MTEARPSSFVQRVDESTNVSLEAGALKQISATETKQDDREVQSNTKEMTEDFAVFEDGISPLTESTCTLLTPKVEVPREKTRLERRHERTYSRPADPEYTRFLGQNAFNVIHTAKASTRPDFQKSQSNKKEYKGVSGPPVAGESEVPIDWDRNRLHKPGTGTRLALSSQDPGDHQILSSRPAVAPAVDTVWPQGVFGSTADDEYREIFRRHNFSFSNLPPTKKSICRVCGLWKPANRDPKFICNDCYLASPTTKSQPCSSSSLCRRCGNCLLDKPIYGFRVINGRPVCFDCRAVDIKKRTDQESLNQHADHRNAIRGNMTIQSANGKRRRTGSRPPAFVDSKNLLPSLRNPFAAQKAGSNRRSYQEEEAIRSFETLSQQDQPAWQYEESVKSDNTEPPSSTRYSHAPSKSNCRLIDLGIKTASNGPPIWIKVSRSAPLGDMFVAALQSDNALRGYAFMLPGQFVRWDDTPDEIGLTDNDCFEMHELPKAWLPNARRVIDEDITETSSTSASLTPENSSAEAFIADALLDAEKTSSEAEPHDARKTLYFGETRQDGPDKICKAKNIAYGVQMPEPINAPNTFSLMSYHQPTPSNSSATSTFSLPKVSAETEAELLAVLAREQENSPSHASTSEHRYSPLLRRDSEICDQNTTIQQTLNSASRSPSIIFLHETNHSPVPQEKIESQNIKANVQKVLSQHPPI